MKFRFDTEIIINKGRIVRSTPLELLDQGKNLKASLHTWIKNHLSSNPDLANASGKIYIRGQYVETAKNLTIEFKVQSVALIE